MKCSVFHVIGISQPYLVTKYCDVDKKNGTQHRWECYENLNLQEKNSSWKQSVSGKLIWKKRPFNGFLFPKPCSSNCERFSCLIEFSIFLLLRVDFNYFFTVHGFTLLERSLFKSSKVIVWPNEFPPMTQLQLILGILLFHFLNQIQRGFFFTFICHMYFFHQSCALPPTMESSFWWEFTKWVCLFILVETVMQTPVFQAPES